MNTIHPLLILGMMLTVIFMGAVSVILFRFIPHRMGEHQKRIVKQFILYFSFGAMAFVAFLVLPSWIPREVIIITNSLFYVAAIYFLRQGLLVRKEKTIQRLVSNPIFCINILGVATFQYVGYTYFPEYYAERTSLLNLNIMAVFLCCLPLVSSKRSGEVVVRYAIYFSMLLVIAMSVTLFVDSLTDFYPLFVMAVQAVMFLVWLGALFGLLLADSIKEHYQNSMTDVMTGVHNRRYFFKKTNQIHTEFISPDFVPDSPTMVAIIICDIDKFKRINDKHGHATGDIVIKHFSQVLKSRIREQDILARIGGEEFAIFLPNTSLDIAKNRAEQLRNMVERSHIHNIRYTASFGIAAMNVLDVDAIETLLGKADKALYRAKKLGRNTVCTYIDANSTSTNCKHNVITSKI